LLPCRLMRWSAREAFTERGAPGQTEQPSFAGPRSIITGLLRRLAAPEDPTVEAALDPMVPSFADTRFDFARSRRVSRESCWLNCVDPVGFRANMAE
jgi:hypothetical protein